MLAEVEITYELDLSEPSQELLKLAEEKLNEDPATKYQILAEFRDMIYGRGECRPSRTDDDFLLRFLRSRKFMLEAAYKLFLNYHDFKEENSSYIEGVNFSYLEKVGESDLINVPPYRDQKGRRILLYKLGNWNPASFTADDILRASLLILELAVLEPKSQICGGICIIDCENISMHQALHMTPRIAYKIFQLAVTSHPMKLEAMHIINQSWIFDIVFNLFKPFLHEKMKERIYFHGTDKESLQKHVDLKCLPDIYGGLQPYYTYNEWIIAFRKNINIVKGLRSSGYDV